MILGNLLQEKERTVKEINRAIDFMRPEYILVDI